MFRALPCFIQLQKPNMVERCAWCSLITMHYFTHIYSASLLLAWRGVGGWVGDVSGCLPKHMHAPLFLSLTHRVNGDHDRESPYPYLRQSTASFSLLRGYFLFHSEVVKMHKHHGYGTVTHWPTSTKEKVFFFCLDKHTRKEYRESEGR